jgi:hypothetical protein
MPRAATEVFGTQSACSSGVMYPSAINPPLRGWRAPRCKGLRVHVQMNHAIQSAAKCALLGVAAALAGAGCTRSACGNHVLSEVASPGGKYVVTVFTRDCGATTALARVVALRKARSRFNAMIVSSTFSRCRVNTRLPRSGAVRNTLSFIDKLLLARYSLKERNGETLRS